MVVYQNSKFDTPPCLFVLFLTNKPYFLFIILSQNKNKKKKEIRDKTHIHHIGINLVYFLVVTYPISQ